MNALVNRAAFESVAFLDKGSPMSKRLVRSVTTAVAALIAASAMLVAGAAPAAAAEIPYQDWSQTPGNTAGVKFTANGDWFEIWDNVHDDYLVTAQFHYQGVDDDWKFAGQSMTGYARVQRNVYEEIGGAPAYIYFRVCDRFGCSHPSRYKTYGL
jgi:hypothetical protein